MNDILEYDPETKVWTKISTMREGREALAVSVVDYRDYADYCDFSFHGLSHSLWI